MNPRDEHNSPFRHREPILFKSWRKFWGIFLNKCSTFFIHHAINMSTCFWRCHESEVKWILWREESIWGGNLSDLNSQRNCHHLVNKGQGTLKWWKLVLKPLTISLFLLQDSWSFSSITEAHLTLTLLEVSEQYCFSLLLVLKYLRIKLPPGLLLPQKGA